jgi:hypothetical protein
MRMGMGMGMVGVAFVAMSAVAQVPTRTLVEELKIDGTEHEFSFIFGVLPMRNGNVIVVHPGDFSGTVFSAAGAQVRKFARKGAGPGEVQELNSFGMIGDSVWISDRGQNRITLFGADGGTGRNILLTGSVNWPQVRPAAKDAYISKVFPSVLLPGDVAIGAPGIIASAIASGAIMVRPYVRLKWDGTYAGLIADMPLSSNQLTIKTPTRTTYSSQPFTNGPRYDMSRNGAHIVFVEPRESPTPVLRYLRLNTAGDTVARAELAHDPTPIPARALDSAIAAIARSLNMPQDEGLVRAAVKAPKFYSPVNALIVANDGSAWLRGPALNGKRTWLVVSPAGKLVEKIELPHTTDIRWIDGSIWAITRDADDVPSVVRLRRK